MAAFLPIIENKLILRENNKLSANFIIFERNIFDKVTCILSDIIDEVANCMIDISDKAEKILAEHAPASLKGQCGDIAKIHTCCPDIITLPHLAQILSCSTDDFFECVKIV